MGRPSFYEALILFGVALIGATGAPVSSRADVERVAREPAGALRPPVLAAPSPESAAPSRDLPRATEMPRLAARLRSRAQALDSDELVRVIVLLESAPQLSARRSALEAEKGELAEIRSGVRAARGEPVTRGGAPPPRDLDRGTGAESRRAEREALRPWLTRQEAVSARIGARMAAQVRAALEPEQARVRAALEALGGEVERELHVVNALVARVPAGRLEEAAQTPGVVRIAGDTLETAHLTTAAAATRVNAPGGLWAAGETGGLFDPAIIDSGVDRMNPLLADEVAYTNFWAWSLTAASGDPGWADALDEDDRQGHGTNVQGIVASHGSPLHPTHLGLAYGLEQVVQLKAGFCCSGANTAMYNSDRMAVIDLALYSPNLIQSAGGATGTFEDDVDGMNVSYGASTLLDDTDASRFIDAVVHTHVDLPITISAGNTGPSNTDFNSPANAFNAITVANVDDQGTATRADDFVNASSSRGPTAAGRRKPDIAAPGTQVSSPNHEWETQADVSDASGTSQAAPMVLGVIMDLMDAGVFDELELKALLVNTATKNDAALDFESDADGWDEALGWGYLNALAAYEHRLDVRSGSVAEDGMPGDYRLYAGDMRDEGPSGEGRDRATLAWNRHAVYDAANAPSTYHSLANLDLHLFAESDGTLLDDDTTTIDNVHQVRIGPGAPSTPVVVRVDAADADFAHGGATEDFALATEDGFTEVGLPDTFAALAYWPLEVEPGESFEVEFWVRNDDVVASHENELDLGLPAGFALGSGDDPASVGSAAGGAGESAHAIWNVTAPGAPGLATIVVSHSHTSYLEPWGPFDWNLPLTVAVDTTPPTPATMSFAIAPAELTTTQISMRATTASDLHDPVEYLFTFSGSPSGGLGALDSGWQTPVTYLNGGLEPNHEYCFSVRARDAAQTPNETAASAPDCDYTAIETPGGIELGPKTATTLDARSQATPSNLGLGASGLLVANQTAATDSGWLQSNGFWTSAGLTPNTLYTFVARARNGDGAETLDSPSGAAVTLAATPANGSISGVGVTGATAEWEANSNPAGTEYLVENQTTATDSGWITALAIPEGGLSANTAYDVRVKARNLDLVETGWLDLPSFFTWADDPVAEPIGPRTHDSIEVAWSAGANPPGTEYLAENVDTAETSGWSTATSWTNGGLSPSTAYEYRVKARNGDAVETGWVALGVPSTMAAPIVPGLAVWGRGVLVVLLFGASLFSLRLRLRRSR